MVTKNRERLSLDPDGLQTLLDRIAEGDEEAFRDFYSSTVRRLFGLALQVVRNRELAEEVVQEVYIQVWLSARTCDPSHGTPLAWLLTITHRRAVDVVRREQSCRERDARHHRESSALGQVPTEDLVLHKLDNEEVLAGLAAISDLQAEAIALAYLGGQTYEEVARTLNVSLPAVKSRIRGGFSKLRQSLEPAQ